MISKATSGGVVSPALNLLDGTGKNLELWLPLSQRLLIGADEDMEPNGGGWGGSGSVIGLALPGSDPFNPSIALLFAFHTQPVFAQLVSLRLLVHQDPVHPGTKEGLGL